MIAKIQSKLFEGHRKRLHLMKIIENMRFLKVGTEIALIYNKETLLKKYFIIRRVKDDN